MEFVVTLVQNYVGLVLPPLIDLINRRITNSTIRFWVSILIVFLVAMALHAGELVAGSPEQFLESAAIIFAEAQIVYHTWWKKSETRARMMN